MKSLCVIFPSLSLIALTSRMASAFVVQTHPRVSFPPTLHYTEDSSEDQPVDKIPLNPYQDRQQQSQAKIYSYRSINDDAASQFRLQDVPGAGDCMFLAAAGDPDADPLWLRQRVAQIFLSDDRLFVSDANPAVPAHVLLKHSANEYGTSPSEYLKLLATVGGMYGGGPELVILSSLFEVEIAIYEVSGAPEANLQQIELQGVFGEGQYADRRHILVRQMGDEKHASILMQGL